MRGVRDAFGGFDSPYPNRDRKEAAFPNPNRDRKEAAFPNPNRSRKGAVFAVASHSNGTVLSLAGQATKPIRRCSHTRQFVRRGVEGWCWSPHCVPAGRSTALSTTCKLPAPIGGCAATFQTLRPGKSVPSRGLRGGGL